MRGRLLALQPTRRIWVCPEVFQGVGTGTPRHCLEYRNWARYGAWMLSQCGPLIGEGAQQPDCVIDAGNWHQQVVVVITGYDIAADVRLS